MATETIGVVTLASAVGLGLLHGAEPGHGWPIAATYALDKPNKWVSGLTASTVLGVGHLVSSLAVVALFFAAKSTFGLESVGWMSQVAGVLLIALGVREYRHGHSHAHDDGHDHGRDTGDDDEHDGHARRGGHDHSYGGGHAHDHVGHDHTHDEEELASAADRGIWALASSAFVLGFAHEEEFQIIGLCAGSDYCLALMITYALAVIVGIVGFTLTLIAGYRRFEDRMERYADHFPTISAGILVLMGIGFVFGLL